MPTSLRNTSPFSDSSSRSSSSSSSSSSSNDGDSLDHVAEFGKSSPAMVITSGRRHSAFAVCRHVEVSPGVVQRMCCVCRRWFVLSFIAPPNRSCLWCSACPARRARSASSRPSCRRTTAARSALQCLSVRFDPRVTLRPRISRRCPTSKNF